jgi:3-ketoacyl-CoA synthase
MGCANGVIGIGLIRDLLVARPNALALFVPSEICTYALYPGNKKEFLVANVLFRMGGASILLANRHRLAAKAKYALQYNTRVHTGQDDGAYG